MTAADKLRELLASRPAMPNTEELVRWWRTSAELLPEVLRFASDWHFMRDVMNKAVDEHAQLRADLDAERARHRREQDARADLRLELDRMRPVYEAALRLRAITKRAEQQQTPALLNQQIIENANAFRELFDAVDAVTSTFEAGDVVRLRATDSAPAGLPMTIEDVCSFIPGKGIGVRCVWFDDTDNLHRDVFDPSALEHTAPKEAARG